MLRPMAVWKYDGATYTDLTSNIKTSSTFNWLSAATDYFYIGLDRRFVGLYCDLSTNGSYTGITFSAWEGESTWTAVEEIEDYNFSEDKFSQWNLPYVWTKDHFTSTSPHSATPPDNVERYWIRVTCSAATTTAVIEKLRCIPYAMYSTPELVASKLGLPNRDTFGYNTEPLTIFEVEDKISEVQDEIDYKARKSWKFNYIEQEEHDFNLAGIKLWHPDIINVYSLQIWDGADWETKTAGRTEDYFTVNKQGMLFFSRYFLLPARLAYVGPHWWGWGIGEFKYAIRIEYSYGRDWEKDQTFRKIQDLASKMTALKVIDATNYLALMPEGIRGGVDLSSKVERWRQEIEDELESLVPMEII